jgi:hypothetical protein
VRARTGRARLPRRRGLRRLALAVALAGLALSASACASDADTPAALAAWASQATYGSNNALLRTDLEEIASGIAQDELVPTRTACDGLGTDAANAIGELPTPDNKLTNELNAAYSDLVNAAQSCSEAPAFASPDFTRYRRRVAAADRELTLASLRYKLLAAR